VQWRGGRITLQSRVVMRGQKRVEDARKRAYYPRIHLLCKKVFAKVDGLPGHERVYARLRPSASLHRE
jgi:hypothetical protein